MRNKLDYIYYRFYRFQVSVGNSFVAVPFALLFLTYLLILNFFSIVFFLYGLAGIKAPWHDAVITGSTCFLLVAAANYLLFIYKKRYRSIIKLYQNEPKHSVKRGNIAVVIYIIVSLALIGMGLYLMILRNGG